MTEAWSTSQRWDDRDHAETGAYNLPGPPPQPRFDERTWTELTALVTATSTRDRVQIRQALDAANAMDRGDRVGLKTTLKVGIWCAMTALNHGPWGAEEARAAAEQIFPRVTEVVTPSVHVLEGVLEDCLQPSQGEYSLPEAEFILIASVALGELVRIAPGPGSDLDAIRRHCSAWFAADHPHKVQDDWLRALRS